MLKKIFRHILHHQKFKYDEQPLAKVMIPTEVAVRNPHTGEDETQIVNVWKEESLIDPHLRASDFDLQVQIRNGVQLKDCGYYLQPSSPEEYNELANHYISNIEKAQALLNQPPFEESKQDSEPSKSE